MDKNLKTVFITGTDTGVGKSIFSSYLALKLSSEGKKVAISKPIQTGTPKDTDFLKELTGNKIPIFNTYSFLLGAAPSVASEIEDKIADVGKIISDIRILEKEFDCVIVEGIGGIAVPIKAEERGTKQETGQIDQKNHAASCFMLHASAHYLVADLIKDLNYPVIIIARPSLGTINHTILSIEFAKQKGLNVLGFVVSGYDFNSSNPVIKTAPDEISKITKTKCLMKFPLIKNFSTDFLENWVKEIATLIPMC